MKRKLSGLTFLIIVGIIILLQPPVNHFLFNRLKLNNVGGQLNIQTGQSSTNQVSKNNTIQTQNGPLPFSGTRQFVMEPQDNLGRAHKSHIQMKYSDKPKNNRATRLNYNPPGWHNYQFKIPNSNKKDWEFARGHLVGYQFCGLNDEPKNLVQETAWFNSGNYNGIDETNIDSMIFYENKLAEWMKTNQSDWLDYSVEAIYRGNELMPRQIKLQFVGINSSGQPIQINTGGHQENIENSMGQVILNNTSPNANIDYATGMAKQK